MFFPLCRLDDVMKERDEASFLCLFKRTAIREADLLPAFTPNGEENTPTPGEELEVRMSEQDENIGVHDSGSPPRPPGSNSGSPTQTGDPFICRSVLTVG